MKLRVAKGLTKESVAKRAGMTPTTYGRIERGQHTQTRKLQDIADVFSVDISEVLAAPQAESGTDSALKRFAQMLVREANDVYPVRPVAPLPSKLEREVNTLDQLTEDEKRQELSRTRRPRLGRKK